jgi:hypothetical protein
MKGILSYYLRLASRAAIGSGTVRYCQHQNQVEPGMWSGGIVGVKSILGLKSADKAVDVLMALSDLDLISFDYNRENKHLTYMIRRTVCSDKDRVQHGYPVYAFNNCGFLRIPRRLTDVLIKRNYKFEEADAWLDIWCHTVANDSSNIFSCLFPCIQFHRNLAAVTLETLGKRWGWNKTKVQRFFVKHKETFCIRKLPGSYGCIIFNRAYDDMRNTEEPSGNQISTLCQIIKKNTKNNRKNMTDRMHFCMLVLKYSRKCLHLIRAENRVSSPFKRTYISLMNCIVYEMHKDCGRTIYPFNHSSTDISKNKNRGSPLSS